jgi:ribosomal-protein-alanine N-acetyltransferase
MNASQDISTARLRLRRWRTDDRPAFAALNADPRVMEFFPSPLTVVESDALADRIDSHFTTNGFGFWALEVPGVVAFAGFVGLSIPRFDAHFMPSVEIGWRVAANYWGQGFATEAARAALEFGFGALALREIVSMTVPANIRSRRVMERIGMVRNAADDFDHPGIEGALRRHVLYRIRR